MAALNTSPQPIFPDDPINDDGRLEIIFRALMTHTIPTTVNSLIKGGLNWRHLSDLQIGEITNKIIATDLVEFRRDGYHYSILLKPHAKAALQKFGNSYLKYSESLNQYSERLQERENLEMQKLRGEVEKLVNELSDYRTTKMRARNSYVIAILSICLAVISLLLPWVCKRSG